MTDISSLLDATLDDLADLPAFKPFPVGATRATIEWEQKEINNKPAIMLNMVALETLELVNATDEPVKAGDKDSVMFQLDNEFGQGKFKAILAALAGSFGGNSPREIMEASNKAEVVVVVKHRKDKKDPDRVYTDIVQIAAV